MKLVKKILCLAIVLATLMTMVILPIPTSAADPDLEVVGAAIRTEGTQALRFVGRVKKSAFTLTYGNSANFGMLIIPKYMVNSGATITSGTSKVLSVKATKAMEYNHPWIVSSIAAEKRSSDYVYFVVAVTGIAQENYKTDFLARVYVNSTYSTQDSRSVRTVANGAGLTSIVSTADSYGTDICIDVGGM